MKFKVTFDYDPDPDLSWLSESDTPDKYKDNEIVDPKTREPLSFDDYMATYGNPDKHVTLQMFKYESCDDEKEHCPSCTGWVLVDSLGQIDFMDWDNIFIGTIEYDSLDDEAINLLHSYQRDLLG